MASSRMIATRKRPVFMSHICSKCGFPMISVLQIESEAQKTYTFSQERASQIASDTAENAIEDEIRRIESCRRDRVVLVGKLKKGSMISPGYFCNASFSGHQTRCPYCGNLEPWKGASLNGKTIDQLADDNFPVVFKDANDAENWATSRVNDLIEAINNQRQNAAAVRNSISSVLSIRRNLEKYLELSASIPEKDQLTQLKNQLTNLEMRKGQLGILDLKGKKEIGSAIKITELKIADISKVIAMKDAPYLEKIQANRYNLLCTQAVAFGCTNQIVPIRNGNAFSYQYVANDIPEEFLIGANEDAAERIAEPEMCEKTQEANVAQTSTPLFCRKCGYKLLPDSVFCTKCGSRV